jgi:hypothetical protein
MRKTQARKDFTTLTLFTRHERRCDYDAEVEEVEEEDEEEEACVRHRSFKRKKIEQVGNEEAHLIDWGSPRPQPSPLAPSSFRSWITDLRSNIPRAPHSNTDEPKTTQQQKKPQRFLATIDQNLINIKKNNRAVSQRAKSRVGWIPTETNWADGPSRLIEAGVTGAGLRAPRCTGSSTSSCAILQRGTEQRDRLRRTC